MHDLGYGTEQWPFVMDVGGVGEGVMGGGGHTTRYGNAYFLSSRMRMNQLLVPLYSISAMRRSAAAEWSTGRLTRLMTLVRMTASLSVQLPAWQSGSNRPCGSNSQT